MDRNDTKRVKAWLYSIRKTELALVNLRQALAELETRRESPPTWMRSPELVSVVGGESESKQENWVEFLEVYPARKSFLEDNIVKHETKLRQYRETLEVLAQDQKWGYIGAEIIRKKYYCKIQPDKAIYTMFLFCSPETFYRAHRRALQFFFDVLPDVFQSKK